MLRERILTSLIVAPLVFLVIFYGGVPLVVLSLLVFLRINYEYFLFATGLSRERVYQLTACSGLIPAGFLVFGWEGFGGGVLCASLAVLSFLLIVAESETHEVELERMVPAGALGIVYVGVFGGCLVAATLALDHLLLVWLLAVVIAADTFAYFGGRLIGGAKLAERISPNKTLSGALVGLVAAGLTSLILAPYLGFEVPSLELFGSGLAVGILAVIGDLVESMVKRTYHVKDTASFLPGHGGLLDRIDGLLFATPLLFLLL